MTEWSQSCVPERVVDRFYSSFARRRSDDTMLLAATTTCTFVQSRRGRFPLKAQWDVGDYKRMVSSPLAFTDEDVILIRRGMEGRAARLR